MSDSQNAQTMPNANPPPSVQTSRRNILSGSVAATAFAHMAVPTAQATPNADAELIAWCAQFHAFNAEQDRLSDAAEKLPIESERAQLERQIQDMVFGSGGFHEQRVAIARTPAKTLEGMRAKASVAMHSWDGDGYHSAFDDNSVAMSLAHDILGTVPVWREEAELMA